jgi:hypothetical protein
MLNTLHRVVDVLMSTSNTPSQYAYNTSSLQSIRLSVDATSQNFRFGFSDKVVIVNILQDGNASMVLSVRDKVDKRFICSGVDMRGLVGCVNRSS